MGRLGFIYSLILFLPFYTTIFTGFFKKHLGYHGICYVQSVQYLLLNFFLFFFFFFVNDIRYNTGTLYFANWFNIGKKINCDFIFHLDFLSYTMSWLVCFLGFFAVLYGYDYCKDEPHGDRVINLLSIFIFSMIILFNAYNLIVFMLAWECTGVISCFLINYWNTKINAVKSSFKSFVINRFGDFGLLFACYVISYRIDSFNFSILNAFLPILSLEYIQFYSVSIPVVDFIAFFLMLAVFTKSAQFCFHSWLPDAMEAPTPASALIHSSAMVIAGIYLMMRLGDLFYLTIYIKKVCAVIGSITAIYTGFIACFQVDLKKILAFSTVSHLGLMVGGCGLGMYDTMLVYLLNHSLSKCLLFFCAGVVIVYCLNIQDIRKMGNLSNYLPIVMYAYLLSSLSLIGWPLFNGFYAKHLVLELFFLQNFTTYFYFTSFLLAGIFTFIYCFKSYFYMFFGPFRGYAYIFKKTWITPNYPSNILFFKYTLNQGYLSGVIMLILVFLNIIGFDRCVFFYNYAFLNWSTNTSYTVWGNNYLQITNVWIQKDTITMFYFSWIFMFFILLYLQVTKRTHFVFNYKYIYVLTFLVGYVYFYGFIFEFFWIWI